MSAPSPFAQEFLCEHTSSKSRVFARLSVPGGPSTLKAVFTCASPVLAERAAAVLSAVAVSGGGAEVEAVASRLLTDLPAAQAVSFRDTLAGLRSGKWPAKDDRHLRWDEVDAYDTAGPVSEVHDEWSRTPGDARLAELPGKVVRVAQLVECHVHDADRLFKAAMATGWSPMFAEDPHAEPDDDLIAAVMHLIDGQSALPGADLVSHESTGEVLTVAAGDELADWQQVPVTVDFGLAWRQHEQWNLDPEGAAKKPLERVIRHRNGGRLIVDPAMLGVAQRQSARHY